MKILRELPRQTIELMPAKALRRKDFRDTRVGSNVQILRSAFQKKPGAVFEIDCGSTYSNHPRNCHTQQAVFRINANVLLPNLVRAYHTNKGTLIAWMEKDESG